MKTLVVSLVALGLMAGAASAAQVGVQIGPLGVGIGHYHHGHHWYHLSPSPLGP
jgi:hypothetical protein